MNSVLHSILLITIAAGITVLLRALPFWVFSGKRQMPDSLKTIAGLLPPAIIAVLVVYCVKSPLTEISLETAASAVALIAVTALHLWKRNTLLSVAVGTVIYMICIRLPL